MNNRDIEWRRKKLKQMREGIESGQLNALRQLLPNEVIEGICEACGYYFRTRLLTPLVTIFHMLSAAICREGSFQAAWHMSGQTGRSGSLSEARGRLSLEVWARLHKWIIKQIEMEYPGERWRGHRMIGWDGTCGSMSDEPALKEHFKKWNSKKGASRFPNVRMMVAFNLKTLINVGHAAGSCKMAEKELSEALMKQMKVGDVLVFDALHSGANLYAEYKRAGLEFIGRAHHHLEVERLKILEIFGENDLLVELPVRLEHRHGDPSLPKNIGVRVIKSSKKNDEGKREDFWIATSLLDPVQYPKQEIQYWQKKRWKIETLIEEMKIWLGTDILRSKSVEGIYKELYARIIALNLIHWLILKAAQKHQQKPDRLSLSAALRLTSSYSLKMTHASVWSLPLLYEELLERIAASKVPHRPGRLEPRMKKREPRKYPGLNMPRKQWRIMYAMAA